MSRQVTIEVEAVAPAGYTLRIEQGHRMEPADSVGIQGESGGLGLGYVDSVPSQDNLQMRRN